MASICIDPRWSWLIVEKEPPNEAHSFRSGLSFPHSSLPAPLLAQKKRPMTVDDLFHCKRLSDPQISPDSKTVAYVVARWTWRRIAYRPPSGWRRRRGAPGADIPRRQLTNTTKKDKHPRWSPDGKRILFESNRSGDNQLWVIDRDGGEARQLTTIATEAGNGMWSPDGKMIAFVSAVWPEYSDKPFKESDSLNKKRKEEAEKNPVKARVFYQAVLPALGRVGRGQAAASLRNAGGGGEPKDVTPGDRDANPTSDTFSIGDDFTFSPDGKFLLFTAPPERDEAWSTNYDICRVPVSGRQDRMFDRKRQVTHNQGGRWIAQDSPRMAK